MKITKTASAVRREMKRAVHGSLSSKNDTSSSTSPDITTSQTQQARKPCILKRLFKRIFSSGRKDEVERSESPVSITFEPRLERVDRRLVLYTPSHTGPSLDNGPNFDAPQTHSILPGRAELEAPGSQPRFPSPQTTPRPLPLVPFQQQHQPVRRASSFQSYQYRHSRLRHRAITQLSIVTEESEASLASRRTTNANTDYADSATQPSIGLPLSRSMSLPNLHSPNSGYEARLSPTSSSSRLSLELLTNVPPARTSAWRIPQPSTPLEQRIADQHAGRFDNLRNSPLAMNPDIWHLPTPTKTAFSSGRGRSVSTMDGSGDEYVHDTGDEIQRAGSWLSSLLEDRFGLASG